MRRGSRVPARGRPDRGGPGGAARSAHRRGQHAPRQGPRRARGDPRGSRHPRGARGDRRRGRDRGSAGKRELHLCRRGDPRREGGPLLPDGDRVGGAVVARRRDGARLLVPHRARLGTPDLRDREAHRGTGAQRARRAARAAEATGPRGNRVGTLQPFAPLELRRLSEEIRVPLRPEDSQGDRIHRGLRGQTGPRSARAALRRDRPRARSDAAAGPPPLPDALRRALRPRAGARGARGDAGRRVPRERRAQPHQLLPPALPVRRRRDPRSGGTHHLRPRRRAAATASRASSIGSRAPATAPSRSTTTRRVAGCPTRSSSTKIDSWRSTRSA